MYKLPIKNILTDSFLIPWNEKAIFMQALAIPALGLVSTWALWVSVKTDSQILNITFLIFYSLAFCYFAITCHRLMLSENGTTHSYNTIRILYFFMWAIIIYGISLVLEMIILTVIMNIVDSSASNNITHVREVLYLPLMYFVGRFSLIFPATALDLNGSLAWSWNATRNNGINILCIFGLFPWLMYFLLSLIEREDSTFVEQALIELLTYFVSAIGIFALSLTYKALQTNAQKQL